MMNVFIHPYRSPITGPISVCLPELLNLNDLCFCVYCFVNVIFCSSAACSILCIFLQFCFIYHCRFNTVLFSLQVLNALSWPEKYQPLHSSEIIGNSAVIKRLRAWLLEWKQCLDKEAKRAKLMMMKEKKKSHKEEGKCSNRLFSSWFFCR